jgi:hypothetical protein
MIEADEWPPRRLGSIPPLGDRLTTDAAARELGVSPHTLRNWRAAGTGPAYFALTRSRIFYARSDLAAWLARRRVVPRG